MASFKGRWRPLAWVCLEVCEEELWRELTTQRDLPLPCARWETTGSKQAATSPGAVLGEDWRPVPGSRESLGGLERLQDQGHGRSAASSQAVPLTCLIAAALTEQPWGWRGDLRHAGMKWEVQTSGCWARFCYSAVDLLVYSVVSSFNKNIFPKLAKNKINWGIKRTLITEKLFFCHLFLSLLIVWLV